MAKWNLVRAAGMLLVASGCAQGPSSGPIVATIAHVGPLSGVQGHFGRDNENGARLAVNELNTQGLTLAGRPLRFELLGMDDAADRQRAPAIAQDICASTAIAVVGHLNGSTSIAAAPTYARCGLVRITPSATHPALTEPGNAGSFRLIASDDQLPVAIAAYARNTLKVSNVLTVSDGTAYGNGTADAFDKAARATGIRLDARLLFTGHPAQLAEEIAKRRSDAVFYAGIDDEAGPLIRELRQRSVQIPFLGSDGICMSSLPDASGQTADDRVICAEGGRPLEEISGGREWKRRYDAAFAGQFQVYSMHTYDAVMLIAKAIQRAGSLERGAVMAAMKTTNHSGLTARIRFDLHGDMIDPPVTLYAFPEGRKRVLGN